MVFGGNDTYRMLDRVSRGDLRVNLDVVYLQIGNHAAQYGIAVFGKQSFVDLQADLYHVTREKVMAV